MAPIPGETKVWQYITLMKRIYLIDCPGVVPPNQDDSPEDILMRGVVRVENVQNPEQYISAVLKKTKPRYIERTYDVKEFSTHFEFLERLARKSGRLLKGGEADVDGVAKMVLNDFLRGKLPWFTPPPLPEIQDERGIEGQKGVLGEMGRRDILAKDGNKTERIGGGNEDGVRENEDVSDGIDTDMDSSGCQEELSEASDDIVGHGALRPGKGVLVEQPSLVVTESLNKV